MVNKPLLDFISGCWWLINRQPLKKNQTSVGRVTDLGVTWGASKAEGHPSLHGEAHCARHAAASSGAAHWQRPPREEGGGGAGPCGARACRAAGAPGSSAGAAQQAFKCGCGGRQGWSQEGQAGREDSVPVLFNHLRRQVKFWDKFPFLRRRRRRLSGPKVKSLEKRSNSSLRLWLDPWTWESNYKSEEGVVPL